MKIAQEFREFISRGNVIDLAVGVIIGAAFGKIVNSLVAEVIMPPIGAAMKGVDFSSLFVSLDGKSYESLAAAKLAGAPVIGYGIFMNTVIEFLIIAACVFLLVKVVNKIKREPAPAPAPAPVAPPEPTRSEVLLTEIRDALKK
jgi:large conductance mechanosensitive channel